MDSPLQPHLHLPFEFQEALQKLKNNKIWYLLAILTIDSDQSSAEFSQRNHPFFPSRGVGGDELGMCLCPKHLQTHPGRVSLGFLSHVLIL